MEALTRERERKGWSFTRTAKETGLTEQQLRNLERAGKYTRATEPYRVTVATAVTLMETFPGLDLVDFVEDSHLSVRRRRRR